MIVVRLIIFLLFSGLMAEMLYEVVIHGNAPFFLSKKKVIKKVIDDMNVKDDAVIYELGCGSGYFLRQARKKYKNATLIGVEFSFVPYWIALLMNVLARSRITIIRKNYLDMDLSKADFIYCFLLVEPMQVLGKKFKKECRAGAQIASYQFSIHDFEPVRIERIKKMFGTDRIYYYKI